MESLRRDGSRPERAADLLESFRWTQRLARRLVRDPGLAADLHQDTWARALERFGGAVPGRRWLAGTLRSLAYRARRARRRRGHHEAQGMAPEPSSSTDEVIERSEAQRRVAAAVARLPRETQGVLLLHFQEGLSLSAIGRELGCSKSTAGARLQRGLTALRRELSEEPGGLGAWGLLAAPLGVPPQWLPPSPLAPTGASPTASLAALGVTMKKIVYAVALVAAVLVGAIAVQTQGQRGDDRVTARVHSEEAGLAGPEAHSMEPVESGDGQRNSVLPGATKGPSVESVPDPINAFAFRARVVGSDGEALPGARLWTRWRDEVNEAIADGDGRVELWLDGDKIAALQGKGFMVTVGAGRYLTLWERYVPDDGTGRIAPPRPGAIEDLGTVVLGEAGAVEGIAVSTTGDPIPGARVEVCGFDDGELDRRMAYHGVAPNVMTDGEGRFLVGHLLRGRAGLTLRHPDFEADSPALAVDIVIGRTVGPVRLRAAPAQIVTGLVVGPDGSPLEGAYVNGTGNWSVTDTDRTDGEGRFRIGLREGAPAPVRVVHPGWRQVDPAPETPLMGGAIEIRMEPLLPAASFAVRVVDAETGERIRRAGVAALAPGSVDLGPYAGLAPEGVVQPPEGVPVELTPGVDLVVAGARGFVTEVFATALPSPDDAVLTVELTPDGGISGRLQEGGQPVRGARVFLASLGAHVARPREHLVAGRAVRDPKESVDTRSLTGRGGYSPVSVLGLDGVPPVYRLVTMNRLGGTFTGADGRFRFRDVRGKALALVLEREGKSPRVLTRFVAEDGTHDLGEIELSATASLRVRVESAWPWQPERCAARLLDPDVEIPLGADGTFSVDGLQPGATYFTVRARGTGGAHLESFVDVPTFHVDLAPGEVRAVTVDLAPYAPSRLDFELTVGGEAPVRNCSLRATPVDDPERVFGVDCKVDGKRLTAAARALGPCHLSFTQSTGSGGFTRLVVPGGPVDLRPGWTETRKIDVAAGRIAIVVPVAHRAREYREFDLILEGGGTSVEVLGLGPSHTDGGAEPATLTTVMVPTGRYRAHLKPSRWVDSVEGEKVLGRFDVVVEPGATSQVVLTLDD